MNNTVDLPGDLFGVALGAAFILTAKVVGDRLTIDNLDKAQRRAAILVERTVPKFRAFSQELAAKLSVIEKVDDPAVTELSEKFVALIDQEVLSNSDDLNLSV